MMAPFGASEPNSAASPPCFWYGSPSGRTMSRSTQGAGCDSRSPERLAGHRQAVEVQQRFQFAQHRADAAGGKQVRHVVRAGRFQVDQDRRLVGERVETLERHFHAGAAGDGGEVDEAVGGAADGEQHAQRILDRFFRDDAARPQVGADHLHGAAPARLGRAQPVGMDRGDGGGAGQRHAERFGDGCHGARRAHHRAAAGGGGEIAFDVLDVRLRDFAGAVFGPEAPAIGAGAEPLAVVGHGQHRPADRAGSPAGRPRWRPSAAPARSCRRRRSAPPRPWAGRGSFPRRPSPSGCGTSCWWGAERLRRARWWESRAAARPRR